MTHIEAMKQGLEMFDWLERRSIYQDLQMKETHNAIRQAIAEAEAEAEKVEYAYTCVGCDYLSWANNFSCECQSPPLMKFKRVKVIR